MNTRTLLIVCIVSILGAVAKAQISDYLDSSAVDAKGVRHAATAYPRNHPPWRDDCIKAVGPEYPYTDRQRGHMGTGLYRQYVDLKTGVVTNVAVVKSTGVATLDNSAVAAFRKWRYKPGKWKEVDLPVTFTIMSRPPRLPPGAKALPNS
jgi:TonB family protein